MEEKIKELLRTVVHPETGTDIVTGSVVERIAVQEGHVAVTLQFTKARDPFAVKIKNQVQHLLETSLPELHATVTIREGAPRKAEPERKTTTGGIARVIAVASGKGGDLLISECNRILAEEYPELAAQITVTLPDEKMRRVGQSVAAASLPEVR